MSFLIVWVFKYMKVQYVVLSGIVKIVLTISSCLQGLRTSLVFLLSGELWVIPIPAVGAILLSQMASEKCDTNSEPLVSPFKRTSLTWISWRISGVPYDLRNHKMAGPTAAPWPQQRLPCATLPHRSEKFVKALLASCSRAILSERRIEKRR